MRGAATGPGHETISRARARTCWIALALLGGAAAGCHEEPTIIIRFEPQDLSTVRLLAAPTGPEAANPGGGGAAMTPATSDGGARVAMVGAAGLGTVADPAKGNGPGATSGAKGKRAADAPANHETASDGGKCKSNSDCVVVKADCCGCSQGGSARAVSKAQLAKAVRMLAKWCGATTMCVQAISTDPSCTRKASCVAGRCVLVDPAGQR